MPDSPQDDRVRPRGREMSRLEALSDAIFGFSATLLVVSLEAPRTFVELRAILAGFAPFALSFAMLLFIWLAHNAFFRRYGLQDGVTVAINSVLLFVVLFYVYPLRFLATAFTQYLLGGELAVRPALGSFDALASLFAVYGVGFVALFACFVAFYVNAARRADAFGLTPLERYDAATAARHYLLFVLVGALSAILAWGGIGIGIGLPGWAYFLLGPLCFWNGWSRGRRRAALVPAAA